MRNAMRTHLWSERQNLFVFVAWQPWHHRVKWFRLSAFNSLATETETATTTSIVLFVIRSDTRFFFSMTRCMSDAKITHLFEPTSFRKRITWFCSISMDFYSFVNVFWSKYSFNFLEVPICCYILINTH